MMRVNYSQSVILFLLRMKKHQLGTKQKQEEIVHLGTIFSSGLIYIRSAVEHFWQQDGERGTESK